MNLFLRLTGWSFVLGPIIEIALNLFSGQRPDFGWYLGAVVGMGFGVFILWLERVRRGL